MDSQKYETPEYKRSRNAYTAFCAFEYFVSILLADAFLAKILTYMGLSDSTIGVISSLISFSFLFQLLSILVMTRLRNTKKTVIFFEMISQLFFLAIYLIPLFSLSVAAKTVIVIGCFLLAYFCKYLVSPLYFRWANSFVDPHKRGEFSAVKEMISLISGILFTLGAGYVIDRYEGLDNLQGGFLFLAVTILILNICNFVCLLLIKNEEKEKVTAQRKTLKEVLRNTLGNRNFVNVIIMASLWDISRYTSIGFMGTFKTTDLLLSISAVQFINMVANLGRMLVSKPFGRFSDRNSYAKGFRLAMILAACAFAVSMFITPGTWWLIVLYTVLFNVSLAGSNQNSYNITYSYVDSDYLVQAMAIKQSISGVAGFLASLGGGYILQKVQDAGNVFLGIPMYGQQLLGAISLVIALATVLFTKLVIEKQERRIQ